MKTNHPLRCGALIGAAAFLFISSPTVHAQYSELHDFTSQPRSSLAWDGARLYGIINHSTVYGIDRDGTNYSVVHTPPDSTGLFPFGPSVLIGDSLYVPTLHGDDGSFTNSGSIVKVKTDGSGSNGVKFFSGADGSQARDLTAVGSTLFGLTLSDGPNGAGTVFRVESNGTGFQTLHAFGGGDGAPQSLIASGGVLYGLAGGGVGGDGVVFKMNLDGTGYSLLHSFSGVDGTWPEGRLALEGGTLYGVTSRGGAFDKGTIFRLDVDGSDFGLLHSFDGVAAGIPFWGLTLYDGTLYGTTESGSVGSEDSLYSIGTDGTGFQILEAFDGAGGDNPFSELTLIDSILYGTTSAGGANSAGVLFSYELAAVPEPATAAWGLAALAGLALRRSRRR